MYINEDNNLSLPSDYEELIRAEAMFWNMDSRKVQKWKYLKGFLSNLGFSFNPDFRKNPGLILESIIWGRKIINTIIDISARGTRILEIGCGSGWLSLEIARRNPHAIIDAVDIADRMLKIGREYYLTCKKKENIGTIRYWCIDLNKIKLPPHIYDAIISFGCLHHILNLRRLIKEIKKALKINGYFLIYEDNDLCSRDRDRLAVMYFPFYAGYSILKSHKIPSFITVRNKVGKLYDWQVARPSPFEGIHKGKEIKEVLEKNFEIIHSETTRCMIDGLTRNLHPLLKMLFAPPLKVLDSFLLRTGFLKEGRSLFIIATKPKYKTNYDTQ